MRIAMLSLHTSPLQQPGSGDAGGMNVYVISIARELARQGISVDIFTRATRPSAPEVVEVAEHLRVIHVVAGPYEGLEKESLPTQLIAFAGGVIHFIREHDIRYDVIHSHYWLSGQVGWLLRDLGKVPLVHTFHTLAAVKNEYRSAEDTPETEARRICEQQLADNADRLVVNTSEESENLVRFHDADPEKIRVVLPGTDTRLFTPGEGRASERARRLLGIPMDTKVIAFVGRLQTFKGPQILLRAVRELLDRDPQRELLLLVCGGASGRGATPEYYQGMAADLGLGRRVRFLRPRPPEELVEVYRAADIVAVPSYNESFGLVAMEAEATGTPVVAARVGGLPIAVSHEETGVLVDGHDPADWADALERLLADDAQRCALGEAAHQFAQGFSWEATARRLAEVYQECCALEIPGDTVRHALG